MAEILIPVGHDVGPVYAEQGDTHPTSFDVRVGDGAFVLTANEYLVWDLAHGSLDDGDETYAMSRGQLLDIASDLKVPDAPQAIAGLLDVGALSATDIDHREDAKQFAETHRIFPLAKGEGNSPAAPWMYHLSTPTGATLTLTTEAYHVWMYSHLHPSLWTACLALQDGVKQVALAGAGPLPETPVDADATELLNEILTVLPKLVAGRTVYVDRSI